MQNLIDSHAHLDLLDDPDQALAAAKEAGVERILAVGIDIESSRKALDYAIRYREVFAAIGIHPHDAAEVDEIIISELETLAGSSDKIIAIGETGLDYYHNRASPTRQKDAFLMHIELAKKVGLPIIVHSREADVDVLSLLEEYAAGLSVILHCFSLCNHVDQCAANGYFMSFAGNVTFAKADSLREAAARAPQHLILTETDSPYLAPVPKRGTSNGPANVRFTLQEIARLRGIQPSNMAESVFENFLSAFSLKPSS